MNKLFIVLLSAALMCNVACAQKLSPDKIPAEVLTAFNSKFPGATKVKWEMEDKTEYEAVFNLNGEETSANFDLTGKWLETETEIKVSALPAVIQEVIAKDFAGFKINEAGKTVTAKDGMQYEVEIEKGEKTFDVLFTSDGKMLSKKELEEDDKD